MLEECLKIFFQLGRKCEVFLLRQCFVIVPSNLASENDVIQLAVPGMHV